MASTTRRRIAAAAGAALLTLLAACGPTARADNGSAAAAAAPPAHKVLVVFEENETFDQVFGSGKAPFLTEMSKKYGVATKLDAGYPTQCPSLAAYLILTSGDQHGVCDDGPPAQHQLSGDTIFQRVADAGQQWRVYAESMTTNCQATNSGDYAVRHTAAPYYPAIHDDCMRWQIPMGTMQSGALHDDLTAGTLPAFSMAIPNLCNEMHGGAGCGKDLVRAGDDWMRTFTAAVQKSPDWRSGKLTVIVTWDEGSKTDNHIPLLVMSPTVKNKSVTTPATQCAVSRMITDLLAVKPVGCAAAAPALETAFGLVHR
jgi:phosphatidylinositol-3-phosphatase